MRRARPLPFFLLTLALASPLGAAEPADEAKRAFDEGVALEKQGAYAWALVRFRDAGRIKTTAGVLFHEGYCLEMTGKLASALETYESAEQVAREQGRPETVSAVRARVDPLLARIARLAIHVEPANAYVRVDGRATTTRVLRVDPGDHEIAASAPAYAPKRLHLALKEGATENVSLVLEPITTRSAPAAAPASGVLAETPTSPHRRGVVLPLVVTAGAVVLAGSGIASFAAADSAQRDAEATCPGRVSCESERDEVRLLDGLALAGFVGSVGLGALAVVLWSSRSSAVSARGSMLRFTREF